MMSLIYIRSHISILTLAYDKISFAGSRLMNITFLLIACKNCYKARQNVVFPLPGGPITAIPNFISDFSY